MCIFLFFDSGVSLLVLGFNLLGASTRRDGDALGLGTRLFWGRYFQYSIVKIRLDAVEVDVSKLVAARKFALLETLTVAAADFTVALDRQDAFIHGDINIFRLDTWHIKDHAVLFFVLKSLGSQSHHAAAVFVGANTRRNHKVVVVVQRVAEERVVEQGKHGYVLLVLLLEGGCMKCVLAVEFMRTDSIVRFNDVPGIGKINCDLYYLSLSTSIDFDRVCSSEFTGVSLIVSHQADV